MRETQHYFRVDLDIEGVVRRYDLGHPEHAAIVGQRIVRPDDRYTIGVWVEDFCRSYLTPVRVKPTDEEYAPVAEKRCRVSRA